VIARTKLNSIYLICAAATAGIVGALANSVFVFAITLTVAGMLHDGTLRIKTRK